MYNETNCFGGKNIVSFTEPLDHALMMDYLNLFAARYDFLEITSLGESILGRSIPMVRLGKGKKSLFYVGAHHGMEWITSVLLLKFINEYAELKKHGKTIYGLSLDYIFDNYSIYVVPMLNPDGVEYQIHGVEPDNIIYSRLLAMNDGSTDFSRWQANARGVDLNHNYDSGFTDYKALERKSGIVGGAPTRFSGQFPESEPETRALANFLRYNDDIKLILTLHSQGEEIYYTSGGRKHVKSDVIGRAFAQMTGYDLSVPEGLAAYGGLTDYVIEKLNLPSFTIEVGKGRNPLPLEDYLGIYSKVREMLFSAVRYI